MKLKNILRNLALCVVGIAVLIYVGTVMSMNFTSLGVFAIAVIFFIHLFSEYEEKSDDSKRPPLRHCSSGLFAAALLTVFSVMTLLTLKNYFYAEKEVYTNNDHHALKVKGIKIENPVNFPFAKNDNTAFFDDKQFHGGITVESVKIKSSTSASVILNLKEFTHPIYKYQYKRVKKRHPALKRKVEETGLDSAINRKTISFTADDRVKFIAKNGESVEFSIKEWNDTKSSVFDVRGKDTASYYFKNLKTQDVDSSVVTNALVRGYGFNGLLSGVTNNALDFNGISIVRAIAKPKAKNNEKFDDKTEYLIDINDWAYKQNNGDNSVSEIIIGNSHYKLEDLRDLNHTIEIELKKKEKEKNYVSDKYYIGYGDTKTDIFLFETDSSGALTINFLQPYYRQLYGSKDKESNSLYVTASLVDEAKKTQQVKPSNQAKSKKNKDVKSGTDMEDAGFNVANNVALFNIFNHSNNVFNFEPFYLSYNTGQTVESLIVQPHFKDKESAETLRVTGKSVLLGGINAADKSKKVEWIFEIENLRATTPFNSEKMMWVVFIVCLASIIVSCLHNLWNDEKLFHRYAFSYAEFILHIVLIFFISFRCFLLWRTSVFIPMESISAFELTEIFRPGGTFSHFTILIVCLFGFYYILARSKIMMLNCCKSGNSEGAGSNVFVKYCSRKLLLQISRLCVLVGILGGLIVYFISDIDYQLLLVIAAGALALAYVLWELYSYSRRKYNELKFNYRDLENNDNVYDLLNGTFFKFCSNKYISTWYYFIVVQLLLYFVGFLVVSMNPRAGLLVIVLIYFLLEAVIYAKSKYRTYELDQIVDEDGRKFVLYNDFFSSIWNMVLASASIFIGGDTGFLVMFATFCLFAVGFKLQDLYIKISVEQENDRSIALLVAGYILLVSIILLSYKYVIIFIVDTPYVIWGILALIAGAIWGLHRFARVKINLWTKCKKVLNIFLSKFKGTSIQKKILIGIAVAIVAVAMVSGMVYVGEKIDYSDHDGTILSYLGPHTQQRVKVLDNRPDEVLAGITNNRDEGRFLEASYNNWIIEQYHKRSENVSLLGEGGNGYFKIHPQSKFGALWNAQLTDIVLIRYVITEHSKILPIVFIVLLMAMLFQGLRMTTYYRFTKMLLIQIPLLLFVQAMLVWMANTQRFIFFGQDFPLLSITPKFMLMYIFALFILWVFMAVLESVMYRNHKADEGNQDYGDFKINDDYNKSRARVVVITLGIVLFGFFLFGEPDSFSGKGNNRKDSKYTMEALLGSSSKGGKVTKYFYSLDTLFASYQKTNKLELKRDMHPQILKFNEAYKDAIDTLFKRIALGSANNALDSAKNINDTIFPKRIWKNYVNGGSRNNSFSGIVHVHNINALSEKDRRLQISLRNDFYDAELPSHIDNDWKGDIVEEVSKHPYNCDTTIEDRYKVYKLPDVWMMEGETPCLLKRLSDKNLKIRSLDSDSFIEVTTEGLDNIITLNNNDVIYLDNKIKKSRNFWARSVIVNGKNQFIYPQGENMYWIRDFARIVKSVNNKKQNTDTTAVQEVPITLNSKLTKAIFNVYDSYMSEKTGLYPRSVIVADGNGHIKAMVDYKRGYILNPNDEEKISEVIEDLYMNYSNNRFHDESFWFENRNMKEMLAGPGSTQKPLVWNAVASDVDFNWKNLILDKIRFRKLKSYSEGIRSIYYLDEFNGEGMAQFKYQPADELSGEKDIDLSSYLAHSSNYYNAFMVYLGLHNKEHFNDKNFLKPVGNNSSNTESAFRKVSDPGTMNDTVYRQNYPFFKMGKDSKAYFKFNHKISKEDYNKSLLHEKFTSVYGLGDAVPQMQDLRRPAGKLYSAYLNNEDLDIYLGYSVPAASYLYYENLTEYNINSGMRNIAVGSAIWNVTPLKMAEMFGKMVSLNKNYTLSFDPKHKNPSDPWSTVEQYDIARIEMFKGMNEFFTRSIKVWPSNATGTGLVQDIEKNVGEKEINGKTYYFYGKTGTTNLSNGADVNKDGNDDDFRRLAIIISDTKLHEKKIDDTTKVKFYVMFFTHDFSLKGDKFKELSKKIIETVTKSDVFNEYMKND